MADPNRVGGTKRKAPVSFDVRNTLSYAPTPRTLLLNCHSKPRMRAGFFEIVWCMCTGVCTCVCSCVRMHHRSMNSSHLVRRLRLRTHRGDLLVRLYTSWCKKWSAHSYWSTKTYNWQWFLDAMQNATFTMPGTGAGGVVVAHKRPRMEVEEYKYDEKKKPPYAYTYLIYHAIKDLDKQKVRCDCCCFIFPSYIPSSSFFFLLFK